MYIAVKRVFYSLSEMAKSSGIQIRDLRMMAHAPQFEALTLNDNGSILITQQAIDHYIAGANEKLCSSNEMSDPIWDWQLPRQQYMSIQELATYLGISMNTAYTLARSSYFPTERFGKHEYVSTAELKTWLDTRAARFHELKWKGRKR